MTSGSAALMFGLLFASTASAATFSEGRSAYDLNHVAEAERIYSMVVANKAASLADRASSERELARIAWLIDRDPKRALDDLKSARSIGDKPCETSELMARVLRESGRPGEAIRDSGALLGPCLDAAARDGIRTQIIGALLDLAAGRPTRRDELLAEAKAEEGQYSADADVEAARVRLETAVLTDDPDAALAAWKDYFWLDTSDAPQVLKDVGVTATFNNALRAAASPEDRLKLAEVLMRTGFSDISQRFAATHRLSASAGDTPVWRRLQAYWSARKRFESDLLTEYRHFARRGNAEAVLKAENADLQRAYARLTSTLLDAAGGSADPKPILRKAYGLVGTGVGTTDNYPSVHLGHVIEDHDQSVTQFGKTAKIHFIVIDNLLSNGFTSWLWDGSAAVGGWTANGIIVQVRPAYVQSPLRAFQQTRDTDARRNLIKRTNNLIGEDLAKLKLHSVATLEALNGRLQLQVVDRVATVARTRSVDEAGFRRVFLAEFSRANLDQSIVKHEGRHAIDQALGISTRVDQSVLEYQAKLSELELSDYPRMALRNMNRSVEGTGPHDKAVAKIFDQFRIWMEAHTDQIIGYDPTVPALEQFDKLSDSQLREIARELDPLPNGRPSPANLRELP